MAKKIVDLKKYEQERLENRLKEIRAYFLPTPARTRTFKLGDRVEIGCLDNVCVIDVLDDGKIIKVKYDKLNNEGSRSPSEYNLISYWPWTDVFHYRTNEENEKIPSLKSNTIDIYRKFNFSNRHISGIILNYYSSGIEMDTEYQRPLVWSLKQKQALIESMFNSVEIGKFAVIKRKFNPDPSVKGYEMLDGKQRLSTIIEFMEDEFTYKGKKFSELSWRDRDLIENYPILYAEANELSKKEIYEYFLLLNVAGAPQSEDHLNKVKDLLNKVNK